MKNQERSKGRDIGRMRCKYKYKYKYITSFVRGGAIEENIESLCIFVNIRSCYYDGTYHQHNTCVHSLHHQDYAYYRY